MCREKDGFQINKLYPRCAVVRESRAVHGPQAARTATGPTSMGIALSRNPSSQKHSLHTTLGPKPKIDFKLLLLSNSSPFKHHFHSPFLLYLDI